MSKTIKLTDLSNYDSAITGGNNYTLTVVAKGTGVYTRSSKSGGVSYTGATKYSITFNIQNGSATTGSGHNYIYSNEADSIQIIPNSGYALPSISNITHTNCTLTAGAESGWYNITNITGNVTISCTCTANNYSVLLGTGLSTCTISPSSISINEQKTFTLTAPSKKQLPNSITASSGIVHYSAASLEYDTTSNLWKAVFTIQATAAADITLSGTLTDMLNPLTSASFTTDRIQIISSYNNLSAGRKIEVYYGNDYTTSINSPETYKLGEAAEQVSSGTVYAYFYWGDSAKYESLAAGNYTIWVREVDSVLAPGAPKPLSITKLGTTTITTPIQGNTIQIGDVANASSYEVFADNTSLGTYTPSE